MKFYKIRVTLSSWLINTKSYVKHIPTLDWNGILSITGLCLSFVAGMRLSSLDKIKKLPSVELYYKTRNILMFRIVVKNDKIDLSNKAGPAVECGVVEFLVHY